MKQQIKFYQSIPGVAVITAILLLVPFVAMQVTNEVNWSVADFIVAGTLLFSAGLSYVLVTRYATNIIYKIAIGSAIGSTLLLVWVNLAVGLIGAGPNPGNLMYIGVVAIVIIGIFLSRFTPKGMELTMFATSLALVMVAVIALLTNMHHYPESSVSEIIGVNGFFAMLFAISGLLFRYIVMEQLREKSQG